MLRHARHRVAGLADRGKVVNINLTIKSTVAVMIGVISHIMRMLDRDRPAIGQQEHGR